MIFAAFKMVAMCQVIAGVFWVVAWCLVGYPRWLPECYYMVAKVFWVVLAFFYMISALFKMVAMCQVVAGVFCVVARSLLGHWF